MRGVITTATTTDNRPSTLNDRFGSSSRKINPRQNNSNVGGGRTITFNGGANNRRVNNNNNNNNRRGGGNVGGNASGRSVLFG